MTTEAWDSFQYHGTVGNINMLICSPEDSQKDHQKMRYYENHHQGTQGIAELMSKIKSTSGENWTETAAKEQIYVTNERVVPASDISTRLLQSSLRGGGPTARTLVHKKNKEKEKCRSSRPRPVDVQKRRFVILNVPMVSNL